MKDSSVNYKELYFSLFRATEDAIRLLIDAQRACEEEYLAACEAEEAPENGTQPAEGRE